MSSTTCDYYINNFANDSSLCYHATSTFYVSLSTMRNTFLFSSSDVDSSGLDISVIDDLNSDITYYANSLMYPTINFAHSMMFGSHSENAFIDSSNSYNLLKHDFIRYIATKMFGSHKLANLITNSSTIIKNIEIKGWEFMNMNTQLLDYNNNSGLGLSNSDISYNISRMIMKTIANVSPERFDLSGGETSYTIEDTTSTQSIPFIEGDTLNYIVNVNAPANEYNIPMRKYRIKLYLTNDTSLINTQPHDSIADISGNSYGITHYGVP